MKSKIKIYIILFTILIIVLILGLFLFNKYNENNNESNNESNSESEQQVLVYEESNVEEEQIPENVYTDENKVKLGIYINKNGIKTLITEHSAVWYPEEIIGLFYAVPTLEKTLPTTPFDTLWKDYIKTYENASNCRIGYNLEFTLNNGEKVDMTILNPSDAYYMFPKVMVFLYDDVNLVPGKRYYHITAEEMNENAICSSIKLVGDVETENISSPIKLTAFCYDGPDDFDEKTKKYRGNSSYSITINKK